MSEIGCWHTVCALLKRPAAAFYWTPFAHVIQCTLLGVLLMTIEVAVHLYFFWLYCISQAQWHWPRQAGVLSPFPLLWLSALPAWRHADNEYLLILQERCRKLPASN